MKEVAYMLYTNISCSVKTFYGVEFKPGETKEVPGYINHPRMIVASSLPAQETTRLPKQEKQKKSSDKSSVIQKANPEVPAEDTTTQEDESDSSSKS